MLCSFVIVILLAAYNFNQMEVNAYNQLYDPSLID